MTMKKSLMIAHPELRLEKILNDLEYLIVHHDMWNLIPQYESILEQYNEIMED
jgi:hypothetical protein